MKFTDYLSQLQSTKLSSQSKDLIYQRFEAKRRQGMFLQKVKSYSRVATLWLFSALLLGVMYWSNFGGQESGERQADDGIITFNADKAQPVTYADEIGTIIQTVGEVTITSNGEIKQADSLVSSDKVLLLEWAEMTFSVQDGIQAKIIGPAEFEVEKAWETYVINMFSGEFVELKSIEEDIDEETNNDDPSSTDSPTPVLTQPKTTSPATPTKKKSVQVVVKTPEFEISSNTDDGEIDMTITTSDDGKQLVENTGAEVMITRTIKDERVVTELKTQQTASINGQVTIADIVAADPQIALNQEQAEELVATLKDDLTITYKIDEEDVWVSDPDPILQTDTDASDISSIPDILNISPDAINNIDWPTLALNDADTNTAWNIVDTQAEQLTSWDGIILDSPINQDWSLQQNLKKDLDVFDIPSTDTVEIAPNLDTDLPEELNKLKELIEEDVPAVSDTPTISPPTKRVIWGNELISIQSATNAGWLMSNIRTIVTNYAHGNTIVSSNGLASLANSLWPISNNLLWGVYLDRSSPIWLANSIQAVITNLETKRFVPPVYISKLKWTVARLRLTQSISVGSVDPLCDFDCIVDEVLEVPASQRSNLML